MFKKLVKVMVFVLSVLTVYTVGEYLEEFMLSVRNDHNHFLFALVGVIVVAVVLCPFFTKLEDWTSYFSMWFLKTGKNVTGKKIGMFLAFFMGFTVIYYFLFRLWYDYDPWLRFLEIMAANFH